MKTGSLRRYLLLTNKLVVAILAGAVFGLLFNALAENNNLPTLVFFVGDTLLIASKLFINVVFMLIVPIVFFTVVPSTIRLVEQQHFKRILTKTFLFYVSTTLVALTIASMAATFFSLGENVNLTTSDNLFSLLGTNSLNSITSIIISVLPFNPIEAMMNGRMPALIVFSILLGIAIAISGDKAENLKRFFIELDITTTRLFSIIMLVTPYGVFSLIGVYFYNHGFAIAGELTYFLAVTIGLLLIQLFIIFGVLLYVCTRLNPLIFFRKASHALLFAFSTSSSNATIPISLDTARKSLGVPRSIAAINISLGASLHTTGTAIVLAISSIFIANFYGIELSFYNHLSIIFIGLIISFATPGTPFATTISVATLVNYLGLPLEGVTLILAVDRLLDMLSSSVNVAGDMVIACIIAKQENCLDEEIYYSNSVMQIEDSFLDKN